ERYYLFGKEGVKALAEKMEVPLLAQIPVVQDICESGDNGTPAATDPASITGQAFMQLAARVVTETDKRRAQLPPTQIVGVKS
ncbi:MAG: P-loop NTPase, partial [Bacteroidaceae bacterium]|nr:P-loop NTPase [Bacteroidaceae bacterium]